MKKKEMLFLQNEAEKLLKTKDWCPENAKNEPENGPVSAHRRHRNQLKTKDRSCRVKKRSGKFGAPPGYVAQLIQPIDVTYGSALHLGLITPSSGSCQQPISPCWAA